MMQRNWRGSSSVAIGGAIALVTGIVAIGCTHPATLDAPPSLQSTSEVNSTSPPKPPTSDLAQHERSATLPDSPALQAGMRYGDARERLIQQGWQPSAPNASSGTPNLNNGAVRDIVERGYTEVKDCSGTGLGLCRFEFTNSTGELLVVVATSAESDDGEPLVHNWFMESPSDTSQFVDTNPQDPFSTDNNQFSGQDLNQQTFAQVREVNESCGFYNASSSCSYRRYSFQDVELVTERNGTESVTFTVTPYRPISRSAALRYADVLDPDGTLNLASPSQEDAAMAVYDGCFYDPGSGEIPLCQVEMSLTPDGSVATIVFTHTSP